MAAAFPAVTLVLFTASFARPPWQSEQKLKPYECGVEAEGDAREPVLRSAFYIVAILFVIFDVETTFLFPWAVLFSTQRSRVPLGADLTRWPACLCSWAS